MNPNNNDADNGASLSDVGLGGVTYWLIEYRQGGRTVGYMEDMCLGDSEIAVFMTRSPANALKFKSRWDAQSIIDNAAFQRQQPHPERFAVEGHMDCAGPDLTPN